MFFAGVANADTISKNHQLYDRGADILVLQQFLNSHGFIIASAGPGSLGQETGYFGLATYRALKKFQAANGMPSTGYLGPMTRAKIVTLASATLAASPKIVTTPSVTSPSATQTATSSPLIPITPLVAPSNGYSPGFGGGGGDITPPTIASHSTVTAEATSNSGAMVTYTTPSATDNVDTSVSVSCSPSSGSTFAIGTTAVTCSATDRAGNTSTSSFNVVVQDTTAPSVSLTAPSNGATVSGTSVTLSASASDAVGVAGVKFYANGTLVGSEDTSSPYSISWDSTATSSGSKTVIAVARDAASNYATSTAATVTVDNTAPVISSITVATTTSSSLVITWTTDEISDSQVNYGATNTYGASTTLSSALTTAHVVTVSGLATSTTYHFRVRSSDASGNLGVSGDQTAKTWTWTGLGQAMSIAVQGFSGGSNWSETTRSRHYSKASFCRFRVVIPTFYPTGTPIADTDFSTSYDFAVGFEYPYTNANSGIPARVQVTFNGATSTSYVAGSGPYGYIESDIVDLGYCVPSGAYFGLWTTAEVAAHTGSNLLPYVRNQSNYLEKYLGQSLTATSQMSAQTAFTATSISHISTLQSGISNPWFTPAMLLIENDGTIPTIGILGDSIAYGVGEGVSGSSSNGDSMGDSYGNAGYIERGIYENVGYNAVNLARGSDRLQYLATANNWKYRVQLLSLANPTYVIQQNGVNDLTQTTLPSNWAATTAYGKYTPVIASGSVYINTQAGTSGSAAPSGTGGGITDGTATWTYLRPYVADAARAMYRFAFLSNIVDQIRAAVPGVKIIGSLLTPDDASTDSFATAANQTPTSGWGGSTSRRGYFNDQLRNDTNSVLQLSSLTDPSAYLEDSYPTETSKWITNGSANYVTYDGVHPNSTGAALAAPAITPSLFR